MNSGFVELPGADLIEQGLRDLDRQQFSNAALLVAIGAPRLRRLGIMPRRDRAMPIEPERMLYDLVARDHPHDAHSQYNALIRRLVSFERAAELTEAVQRRRQPR